ncbi:Geranylgeranyl transferase type-1 subunit beta [Halotydeus destructor]|nr:Geranylgeranyl transferase type-1 subunit beta [Halotydeus destructor]
MSLEHSWKLNREKHISFLKRCLDSLPHSTGSLDTIRLTVAFFAISGLELLDALDTVLKEKDKSDIIKWIYAQQITRENGPGAYGFRVAAANGRDNGYDYGHIAMTYSSLATLVVLGDDLSQVDRESITSRLKELQLENGSFAAVLGSENDIRFVYCACVICHLLNDWSAIDVERATSFISSSLTYEGAFGQGPGCEAHGGSTYCAVASLVLMNTVNKVLDDKSVKRVIRWCLMKQVGGFQGRPNKDADTCYSFWIGATLKLLDAYQFVNIQDNIDFVLATEHHRVGGLAKHPDNFPDFLHTFLGLSGLALIEQSSQLIAVDAALNVSQRSSSRLMAKNN